MWLVQRVHGAFWVYRGPGVSRGAGNVQGYVVYSGGIQGNSWGTGVFMVHRGISQGTGNAQWCRVYSGLFSICSGVQEVIHGVQRGVFRVQGCPGITGNVQGYRMYSGVFQGMYWDILELQGNVLNLGFQTTVLSFRW